MVVQGELELNVYDLARKEWTFLRACLLRYKYRHNDNSISFENFKPAKNVINAVLHIKSCLRFIIVAVRLGSVLTLIGTI